MSEARRTVRNAGILLAQRGLHLVTATLFALLVPRLMGPEVFGRYSLLTSVSMWFALLSGLGAVSLMTRTVPQFAIARDMVGLRKLVTNLLVLRAFTGIFTATTYFLVIALALGEHDWFAAAFVAGGVLCSTVGNLCFALFLGLNQAARWGMGDLLRRVLTLAGVLLGFPIAGLRGACFGFFAANLVVLVVGLAGAWRYLLWSSLDLRRAYLAPFLRTGTSFAAGNLLLALTERSGETVVRLGTANFIQVGFYGAAYSIYLTGAHALWQGAVAFAPLLITLVDEGDVRAVASWLERILKWMTILASIAGIATLLLGEDLVILVLGGAYRPVIASLRPLALALFALAVSCVGRLSALVVDRPGVSAMAAAVELVTFWGLGSVLAARLGAEGMAFAALIGTALYGAIITWRTRRVLPYSPRSALSAGLLALIVVPMVPLRGNWWTNTILFALTVTAYAGLLLWRRVVTSDEMAGLGRIVWRQRGVGTPQATELP